MSGIDAALKNIYDCPMSPPKETPAPPSGPLYAGYWDTRGVLHGWRPNGTRDWLLLYTESGNCLVRYKGGEYPAGPGDIFLYQPGTAQDYGQHDPLGKWKLAWIHWIPRTEVIEWLPWPELSPGLRHLLLPSEMRGSVLKELILADAAMRTHTPRCEQLAANAVERALLFCARVTPQERVARRDPRIQQATNYLAGNLAKKHRMGTVAQQFGFSRARFASLFRQQTGLPPGQYLETQRLALARQLLAYTNQTLSK